MRVNVLGSSAVGKTSLIDALRCGYMEGLFKRSGAAALLSAVASRTVSTGSKTSQDDHKTASGRSYLHTFIPSGVSGLSHPALRPQLGHNALPHLNQQVIKIS